MDSIIRALAGLLLFGLLIFAMSRSGSRLRKGNHYVRKSRYMQSIDRLALQNGKWIELVEIGEEIVILSVSEQGIEKLGSMAREDLHEHVSEEGEHPFKTLLEKYISRKPA
jgi:flagellar protein FliO/FliZ